MPVSSPVLHVYLKLLGLALLATLMHAGVARAHASLNATEPADGSVVLSAPQIYLLTFSEPVSPLLLRLVEPDGSSVSLDRFTVRGNDLEIEAVKNLRRGTHVLSWRVVSADGHPVGGSVIFSIGEVSRESPIVQEEIDWTLRGWLWSSKVALYIGLFVGVGGVFARRILMPGIGTGDRVIAAALAVGAAGAIVSLGFQGLDALDAPMDRLTEPATWSAGLRTSYGFTIVVAFAAFALAGGALFAHGRSARWAALFAWLLTGTALALSGHASAAAPQWLMRPAVFLHVAAITVWIGALAPLGLALHKNRAGALRALHRFSRSIPAIVAILILAGVILAVVQVERPEALLSTSYGRVFLTKLALLVCLFLLAVANRWYLTAPTKAGDAVATRRLVRSIATETLIVFFVLGVTAAWRFTPPPRVLTAAAPATTRIHTESTIVDLTVAPGRAGPVAVSAAIMTGESGSLDAREVTFAFSNSKAGIEPFRTRAEKQGANNWRADVVLPLSGEWRVGVEILVSDFEVTRLDGLIAIGP